MSLRDDILAQERVAIQAREELRQAAPIMVRMAREFLRDPNVSRMDLADIKRQLRDFDIRDLSWKRGSR